MKLNILLTAVIAIHRIQSLIIPEGVALDSSDERVYVTGNIEVLPDSILGAAEPMPIHVGVEEPGPLDNLENDIAAANGNTLDMDAALLPIPLPPIPLLRRPTVTASLPQATIIGSSLFGVETFNGIPYAQPPVGNLRFRPPQPLQWPAGKTVHAIGLPKACPQFIFSVAPTNAAVLRLLGGALKTPLFQAATNQGEDCLTINVQRPAGTKAGDKLPVLFWIFGGGFAIGATNTYDFTSLVRDSMALKQPMVVVAVNYRVGAFGFMPGSAILKEGSANAGILDQRLGLQWVADNIARFGGDPDKVTIWGESAGAISVYQQMAIYDGNITYKGKPLFRGGIMNSGSITPTDPIDSKKGQDVYDVVAKSAGCDSASNTLECLRQLSYNRLLAASSQVPAFLGYNSIALSYLPRPDGVVLTDSPERLSKKGKFAKVPFIIGDQEDEGTAFSLFQFRLKTTDNLRDYLHTVFFPDASQSQIAQLVDTYPDEVSAGSPFGSGQKYNIYPQFKRLAAILGDLVFTLTRRLFLSHSLAAHPDVPSWSYLASYDKGLAILGTFHGSDIPRVIIGATSILGATEDIRKYYISFVYHLNPNNGTVEQRYWPRWAEKRELMQFNSGKNQLITDDFRSKSYDCIEKNSDNFHL